MPRADEQARMLTVDDDEGEMALQLAEGKARRLDEIAVVVLLDQVGDGLGVGLRREDVAGLAQALAQLAVVLDDAVEDDRDLRRVVARERVRVRSRDAAVRRPARVTEAGGRGRAPVACLALQVLQVPDRAPVHEPAVLEQRDSRRSRSRGTRGARGR